MSDRAQIQIILCESRPHWIRFMRPWGARLQTPVREVRGVRQIGELLAEADLNLIACVVQRENLMSFLQFGFQSSGRRNQAIIAILTDPNPSWERPLRESGVAQIISSPLDLESTGGLLERLRRRPCTPETRTDYSPISLQEARSQLEARLPWSRYASRPFRSETE